jgi:homoserine kinase
VAETSSDKRHPAINTSSENCVLSGAGHTILLIVTGAHSKRYTTCIKKGNSISEYKSLQPAAQHNDVMVKKEATETLLNVAC